MKEKEEKFFPLSGKLLLSLQFLSSSVCSIEKPRNENH
jgi:hypothetical protein